LEVPSKSRTTKFGKGSTSPSLTCVSAPQ
jgi:hypothetical protein